MAKKKATFANTMINGIITENPVFVMLLGMCSTLAITTEAMNGIGMGAAVTVVLTLSNLIISLLRRIIPDKVRIPCFIVVIASFVTMTDLLMKAYLPSLSEALGMFIPLIVVNCIIFARAEAFACKNPPLLAIADGIGCGVGYTLAITVLAIVRELLAKGTVFGTQVMPQAYCDAPMEIIGKAPGAFILLGVLMIAFNAVRNASLKRKARKEGKTA